MNTTSLKLRSARNLLFLLLLIPSLSFAGDIRILRIELVKDIYECTAWGIADLGAESHFKVKVGDTTFLKIISLVNDQIGSSDFVRALIYYNEDGTIQKIDAHSISAKTFSTNKKDAVELSQSATVDAADIKDELEAAPK